MSATSRLRTRFSGDRTFVGDHLEVDSGLTVDVGHAIGDATEVAVQNLLPGVVEAIAHVEPHGIEDARLGRGCAEALVRNRSAAHRGYLTLPATSSSGSRHDE